MELYDGASYRINIEGLDSTLIVDSYRGIIKANLVDNDDFVLVDYDSRTFYGELSGNITDNLGNVILDSEQRLFNGDLVGNIFSEDGQVIYDSIHSHLWINEITVANTVTVNQVIGDLVGNLTGDILNKNTAELVYDSTTNSLHIDELNVENVIYADLSGSIFNNLTGHVVYDSIENSLYVDDIHVNDVIKGNLIGNIFSNNGLLMYDSASNSIEVDQLIVHDIEVRNTITGIHAGTFVGDVYNTLGEQILDADKKTLTVDIIKGSIFSETDGIAYDAITNTFFGKFYGSIVSDIVSMENLSIGENNSGRIVVYNDTDIEDDFGALSIHNFKTSENYSSITLTRSRGSIANTLPVEPGDKLNAILFAAQTGSRNERSPIALLGAKVANDGIVTPDGAPGEISLILNNYNNQLIEGFVVDANGHMKTVIKDFSVVGNTNSIPSNTNELTSWLEVIVNGNKMFIPLYQ